MAQRQVGGGPTTDGGGGVREQARGGQDAREIEEALRREVPGADVEFGAQARALYTMDASNYRRVPVGIVAPRDEGDVEGVLAVCRARLILPR